MRSIKNKLRNIKNEWDFPYRHYFNKNECIFIHIPKTAGSAVLKALGKKSSFGREHLPWYVYKRANPQKFDRYFKFAIVRNPLTRTFSAYNYLRQGGNGINDVRTAQLLSTFNDYDDFLVNGLAKGILRNHPLFIPQSEFVIDETGNLAVDYLGFFENIQNDFSQIAEKLDLSNALEAVNVTRNLGPTETLSEKGVDVIRSLYTQDIEKFRYSI